MYEVFHERGSWMCMKCSIIHYSLCTENSNDCSSHKDWGEMCELVCVCRLYMFVCVRLRKRG